MNVLVIDNYDSFTYNLVYIIRQFATTVEVYRNDKITGEECLKYDAIVLSPGPGIPKDAGNLFEIIQSCEGVIPILGVCLGHQAIAEYLGGKLRVLNKVFHGVQSSITVEGTASRLFRDVSHSFKAGRYHSWDVIPNDTNQYEVLALAEDGSIMAIENSAKQLYGIQFHPESIMTLEGDSIIKNFLSICKDFSL